MTDKKVIKQALEKLRLKYSDIIYDGASPDKAGEFEQDVGDLIAALAQQDSEPVAWMGVDTEGNPNKFRLSFFSGATPLFAMPEDQRLIAAPQPAPAVQPLTVWQPIETAPKDVSILVFHPDGGVCEGANIQGKTRRIWVCLDGTSGWGTYFESEPTHWMPLPAPPAANGIGAPKE